jgi:hypothetical protein
VRKTMSGRKTKNQSSDVTVVSKQIITKPNQVTRLTQQTATSMELARTHRAFGLFPHALLLLGYGESKPEKEREFTVEEKDVQTGATLTRHMKVYTKSENGLPRGRDPQVLLSLLGLVSKKPEVSNSVWFRKSDLIKTLGWSDTPENRQDIEQAIERYFDTAYRGLNINKSKTRDREHEQVRRIITGYDRIDERQVRHKAGQQQNVAEAERLFSKVIFDPEFINDIRGGELSLTVNLDVIRKLKNSSIAVRLYEVINYLTSPENLTFSVPILELAHDRLGISKTLKSPSQCWQKIEKAGAKLLKESYLLSFKYYAENHLITGEVNSKRVSPQTVALAPLPKSDEKRKKLLQQFLNLGTYAAATEKLLIQLPDELLDDAEIIAEFVTREKSEGNFASNFKWGGRAFNQLKHLVENREINQSLLNRHLLEQEETLVLNENNQDELLLNREEEHQPLKLENQLSLPISFTEIQIIDEDAQKLWEECFNILQKNLSAAIIENWFTERTINPVSVNDSVLTLQVSSEIAIDWIIKQYDKDLQLAIDKTTETTNKWKVALTL